MAFAPPHIRLLAEGRATFPSIAVDDRIIVQALGERDTDVRCVADLFLAAAAQAGNAEALRVLDTLLADIAPALRGYARHEVADLVQDLRVKLLVGGAQSQPALLGYSGKGPLRAWMRVALLRAGIDRRRSQSPEVVDEAAWIAHGTEDPAIEAFRRSAGPIVRAAFERALASLAPRDRLILRQHLLDGLGAPELAALYGVHRVTTFRWLAMIRRQVLADVRTSLCRDLDIGEIQLDSMMRALRASAVPTIERMLLE